MNKKNYAVFRGFTDRTKLTTAAYVYMWRFFSTLERVALAETDDTE